MTLQLLEAPPAESGADVLKLWERNLPDAGSERYEWIYGTGDARQWLLADELGSPVGSTGLMLRSFSLGSRTVQAGQAIDLNVDPAYRSIGPALKLQRAVTAAIDEGRLDLVFGMPSQNAEAALKRVGYRQLGFLERWTRPLRSGVFLKRRLPPVIPSQLVAPFVDAGLWLTARENWFRSSERFQIRNVDQFDTTFDDLWERLQQRFVMIGERSAAYLRWRFQRCPGLSFEIMTATDTRTGRLDAYAVFTICDGDVHIADIAFDSTDALDELLGQLCRTCRRRGAYSMSTFVFGAPDLKQTLRKYRFVMRHRHRPFLVYSQHTEQLPSIDEWYVTKADSDTDD